MTVNLKDFRAVLGLAEALGAQLSLWFDGPGSPLVAEPHFPLSQGQASAGLGRGGAGCGARARGSVAVAWPGWGA